MKELTIDVAIENIANVTKFVDAQLKDIVCSAKAQMQIDVAIDELFAISPAMRTIRRSNLQRFGVKL